MAELIWGRQGIPRTHRSVINKSVKWRIAGNAICPPGIFNSFSTSLFDISEAHSLSYLVDKLLIESLLSTLVVVMTIIMRIAPEYSSSSKFSGITLFYKKYKSEIDYPILNYPSLACDHKRTHPTNKGFCARATTTIRSVVVAIAFRNGRFSFSSFCFST